MIQSIFYIGYVYFTVNVIVLDSCAMQTQNPYAPSTSESDLRHIRSPLVRIVYNRLRDDEKQKQDNHSYWYYVDTAKLPEDVCEKFLQFDQDEETEQFLQNCYDKADWFFTQIGHSLAKSVLSWFMTKTSVNGLLQRGSMFVFSDTQLKQLLNIEDNWRGENLLDLGAGDGMVTQFMAKYFDRVYTTEVSSTMQWRLKEKGYSILNIDEWDNGSLQYDLIGCLNLLDRCDQPMKILNSIHKSLTPGIGKAIIAVVLPFNPYVEQDSEDHLPTQKLSVNGKTFEEQATSFIKDVLEPTGFTVEHFTRLPYLCEGDLHKSFYVLHDVVFVIKPKENG